MLLSNRSLLVGLLEYDDMQRYFSSVWFKVKNKHCLHLYFGIVCKYRMWFERFVIIVTSLHRDYCLQVGACSHQPL